MAMAFVYIAVVLGENDKCANVRLIVAILNLTRKIVYKGVNPLVFFEFWAKKAPMRRGY